MSDQKVYRFSDETMATAERIMRRYPEGKQKSALLLPLFVFYLSLFLCVRLTVLFLLPCECSFENYLL